MCQIVARTATEKFSAICFYCECMSCHSLTKFLFRYLMFLFWFYFLRDIYCSPLFCFSLCQVFALATWYEYLAIAPTVSLLLNTPYCGDKTFKATTFSDIFTSGKTTHMLCLVSTTSLWTSIILAIIVDNGVCDWEERRFCIYCSFVCSVFCYF
jgi:hypothetical protein